jgi:hypothetical protein
MKRLSTLVVLVSLFAATVSVGQVIYNSASTAAEGYANGVSNVIAAQGQKNLNDSQARINNQDAYSAAIDNSIKSVNAFWEKKDIYDQRVQEKNYQIQQRREMLLAKNRIMPLTAEEFDRTTGAINWPKILQQAQYNQYRNTLDQLFKKRAYDGALTSDDYMTAMQTSKAWRDFMGSQRNTYPSSILQQMIRFVLKLNRELDDNLS